MVHAKLYMSQLEALEAAGLRRQRRERLMVAVAAGDATMATAIAAHVEPGAETWLVQARAAK